MSKPVLENSGNQNTAERWVGSCQYDFKSYHVNIVTCPIFEVLFTFRILALHRLFFPFSIAFSNVQLGVISTS